MPAVDFPKDTSAMTYIRLALLGVLVVAILALLNGGWYTVQETERGVLLRNGAFVATVEPGLHFKLPVFESVVKIDVTQRALRWASDNSLEAYSQDQQPANLSVSVVYHVPPVDVDKVYRQFAGVEGLESRLIARKLPQDLKTVFGRYTAASVIQNRGKFVADVESAVRAGIVGPLVVDQVNIEDIIFSDAYENSVEQRMLAEIEVMKLRQNAEREKVQAEITVTQAKAAADSQLATATAAAQATEIQAKADAERIRLRGEADAAAIRARADALGVNGDAIIRLNNSEKWNGQLPATMLPGTTLPFVEIK
ncbi:Regulator of protease activity HflC, stomatin/prohibitin superfamily [Pleomorphomonas diazotrophica]|nr:prohibitin family protein [Pleomorphomonas diazotrophica]SFM79174.1 Regulator of protease activity HflC, stomatin/prohibitin superfamily [Pleomorphomonas diazotrophica]